MGNTTSTNNTNNKSQPQENKETQFLDYCKESERMVRLNPPFKLVKTSPEKAKEYVQQHALEYSPEVLEYPNPLPEEFKAIKHEQELPKELRERIIGLLLGQAVGDAVGLSTEFVRKENAWYFYKGEHIRYNHYIIDQHRSKWMNEEYRCADWTDDTDQCILILDSLVHNNGEVDVIDFAKRCYYWIHFGFTELGDLGGLGIGMNFGKTVRSKGWINDPIGQCEKIWRDGGCQSAPNGSVMRTSVLAVPYFWDEERVKENAKKIGSTTHADPRCQASVNTIVLILAKLLQGREDIEEIIQEARSDSEKMLNEEYKKEFIEYTNAKTLEEMKLNESIGYTFKPMGCAILSLREAFKMKEKGIDKTKIFEDLIERIAYEGGDADTNGAVVGAVLGTYLKGICMPSDWLELDNKKWLEERLNRLLHLYELEPFHFK
ncbi:hypothetical protein ENUP19_0259G0038 [Entamoeba nuttalli]